MTSACIFGVGNAESDKSAALTLLLAALSHSNECPAGRRACCEAKRRQNCTKPLDYNSLVNRRERSAKYAPGDIDAAFPHIYAPINLVGAGTRFSGAVHQEEETLLGRGIGFAICAAVL